MQESKKITLGRLIGYLFLGSLLLFVVYVIYVMAVLTGHVSLPSPPTALSRIERSSIKEAQKIMDNYSEGLEEIAAATELLESDEEYDYSLNFTAEYAFADRYEEYLQEMPKELADALRNMEEEFPEWEESILLCKGQVGVWIYGGSLGESLLCYPGEEWIFSPWIREDGAETARRHDMGDGWELQSYYMPKG